VLKVLQKLPEGLAVSVLAASKADLEKQLSILSESLHPLAVEAAFPPIRSHHSLTLDLASLGAPTSACAVLHAATTATNALQKLDLKHIPVCDNEHLLQAISAACRSVLHVCLHFTHSNPHQAPHLQSFVQLEDTLSRNTALTSLQLSVPDVPYDFLKFDCLLESLTSLQTLKLAPKGDSPNRLPPTFPLPPARHVINMPFLTRLCLGHGFRLKGLSEIIPYMTRLQALSLRGFHVEELPPLSSLTALQTLELDHCPGLEQLPPLDPLTALQTLQVTGLWHLLQVPPLATLTALQTLQLAHCEELQTLPPLDTLTALQTLVLSGFSLQRIPPVANLTALQLLSVDGCLELKELPPLDNLTALHTLKLFHCEMLHPIPPLDTLTALQTLYLEGCRNLQELPPLNSLTGLQTLDLGHCRRLLNLPSLEKLTALTKLNLSGSHQLELLPPLGTLTALQTLLLANCLFLKELPPLTTLTELQTLDVSSCGCLRQLPPLPSLQTLQVIGWEEVLRMRGLESSIYGIRDG
jgi:Leucine-rich repeat (LRR) protein